MKKKLVTKGELKTSNFLGLKLFSIILLADAFYLIHKKQS